MSTTIASSSPSSPGRQRSTVTLLDRLQDCAVLCIFVAFAWVHCANMIGGRFTSAPFAVENGLLVGLYITRRRSIATTGRPRDWAVAAVGAWLPLLLQIKEGDSGSLGLVGASVQFVGLLCTVVCIFGLGRSFGIVAANRGLRTGGPYRLVRHPIYAAHLVTQIGFFLANPLPINAALIAIVTLAQLLRIAAEERVLESSSDYATYRQSVRYRLIPGLY